MIPWPYTLTSDLQGTQIVANLLKEIQANSSLVGSELDAQAITFKLRQVDRLFYQAPWRPLKWTISGRIQQEHGKTVISGWIIPSFGAIVGSLILMVTFSMVVGFEIRDRFVVQDWRNPVITVVAPLVLVWSSCSLVTRSLALLRPLFGISSGGRNR